MEKRFNIQGSQYLPLSKVLSDPLTQLFAVFVYETFSSAAEWNRFRNVFVLNNVIDDIQQVQSLYKRIGSYYEHDDSTVTDPTRLMFGGNSLHIINLSNTLPVYLVHLLSSITTCHTIGQQV